MSEIKPISIKRLIDQYTVLLFDAYGVLVHTSGAIDGAPELIAELNERAKPYYILTNDASKLPETAAEKFRRLGMPIAPERIITSGALLKDYFAKHELKGSRCIVLGPDDSLRYVMSAGGRVVTAGDDFDVLVIADDAGFPFLETVDVVISALFHKLDRQEKVHLVLPNPDLIYPKDRGQFGITSGAIALIIEAALEQRYPQGVQPRFQRLGKPHPAIFSEALSRCGTRDMVMIGDQLGTDILGANDFGIDSVLVGTGVTASKGAAVCKDHPPTYYMASIRYPGME
jgi:glycerol-1-phosphatase